MSYYAPIRSPFGFHSGDFVTIAPYLLERVETVGATRPAQTDRSSSKDTQHNETREGMEGSPLRIPAARLIARKELGIIEIDTVTTLRGVPALPPQRLDVPQEDVSGTRQTSYGSTVIVPAKEPSAEHSY